MTSRVVTTVVLVLVVMTSAGCLYRERTAGLTLATHGMADLGLPAATVERVKPKSGGSMFARARVHPELQEPSALQVLLPRRIGDRVVIGLGRWERPAGYFGRPSNTPWELVVWSRVPGGFAEARDLAFLIDRARFDEVVGLYGEWQRRAESVERLREDRALPAELVGRAPAGNVEIVQPLELADVLRRAVQDPVFAERAGVTPLRGEIERRGSRTYPRIAMDLVRADGEPGELRAQVRWDTHWGLTADPLVVLLYPALVLRGSPTVPADTSLFIWSDELRRHDAQRRQWIAEATLHVLEQELAEQPDGRVAEAFQWRIDQLREAAAVPVP